jgi:tRNA threonylcarbamoyladenosine biosynthesis protein TsaE
MLMAILDKWTIDFISSSSEQTVRLGVRLGELLQVRDLICLSGELGVGKTALARGIGRGWGTALRVTSPSYVLVNQYPRMHDARTLYHIDCYRLEKPEEIFTTGVEDILDSEGAFMIEWPERIESLLPPDRLWVELGYLNLTRRTLRFTASGDRSARLLEGFKHSAFGI